MRTGIVWLLSGVAVLCGGRCAWAQAGRFVPRVFPGGGGGRFVHIPHVPVHRFGQDSDVGAAVGQESDAGAVVVLTVLAIVTVIILALVGYHLGWVLGGGSKRSKERGRGRQARSLANSWQREGTAAPLYVGMSWPATGSASAGLRPYQRDLILNPDEVTERAGRTTLLMGSLAPQEPQLDPASLRSQVTRTFCQVQQCWEARDYGPVNDLLCPGIRAEHEELLRRMRQEGEINRIEGLRVKAVDFVHLFWPEEPDGREVAALITFEATVYFVNDRNGAHTRGLRSPGLFQEFWVFRRQGERWLLDAIERTHDSDLLWAANHVAGLSAEQLQNAQHGIAL